MANENSDNSMNPRRTIRGLAILAAISLLLTRCHTETPPGQPTASQPASTQPAEQISAWQPIFVGVEMCQASATAPRPLQIRALRIDLGEPTIDFLVTPSNGKEPLDCNARTVSDFLSEFKCQVAINGSFFSPLVKQKGDAQDVLGLSLSRGQRYSPPNKWDALLISKDRKVWIDPAPIDIAGAYNGLSGHRAILMDGRARIDPADQTDVTRSRHPRSVAGITHDGRRLILMTIDGRQPGYSEGTTLAETAEWARKLGAFNALNLDGGGSTALVIQGPDGRPLVLNRPSGGHERLVANHLGVFAKPLPQAN